MVAFTAFNRQQTPLVLSRIQNDPTGYGTPKKWHTETCIERVRCPYHKFANLMANILTTQDAVAVASKRYAALVAIHASNALKGT